jgi:hypothetical protein
MFHAFDQNQSSCDHPFLLKFLKILCHMESCRCMEKRNQIFFLFWLLQKGNFNITSFHEEFTASKVPHWKTKIPLKIQIFLWQVINGKIESLEQLKKRNWPGPIECKMCGQPIYSNLHIH